MKLNHISKSFDGKTVLDDLTFTFPDGVTCVLGPSGCGKTTLTRLLMGLLTPDSGEITGISDKKISAVFQEDRLFEGLTAKRNVLLTARHGFARGDARRLLDSLGIADPSKRVRDMSGGMKRRVAIARALAADFDLLLLDEPCAGLDGATRETVLRILREAASGKTCVCVTHDPDDIERLGASALYLADGQITTFEPAR